MASPAQALTLIWMYIEEQERLSRLSDIKRCWSGIGSGIRYILDVIAVVYALYGCALFLAVVFMFVFAIIMSVYAAFSSGRTWPQFYALALGLPIIGPLVNLLEELLVVTIRTVRCGFNSRMRRYVFPLLIVPAGYPDVVVVSRHKNYRFQKMERCFTAIDHFIHRFPPRKYTFQHFLTFAIIVIDLVAFFTEEEYGGGRAYTFLAVMLLCAVIRMLRNLPRSMISLYDRLGRGLSVRYTKFIVMGGAFFMLLSLSVEGLFEGRRDIYTFTFIALGIMFLGGIFIYIMTHFILPLCAKRKSGSTAGRLANVRYGMTTAIITAIAAIFFVIIWFCRAIGPEFDSESVHANIRVPYLIAWTIICIFLLLFALGDAEVTEHIYGYHQKVIEEARHRRELKAKAALQNANNNSNNNHDFTGSTASHHIGPDGRAVASPLMRSPGTNNNEVGNENQNQRRKRRDRYRLAKMERAMTRYSASRCATRALVLILLAILFLVAAVLVSMDFSQARPGSQRQYNFNLLNDPYVPKNNTEIANKEYTFCKANWGESSRFNVTDMIMLAKLAIFEASEIPQAYSLWFDGPQPIVAASTRGAAREFDPRGVVAHHLILPAHSRPLTANMPAFFEPPAWMQSVTVDVPRVDVIVIRGSYTGMDWIQDGYAWGDTIFFFIFTYLAPFNVPLSVGQHLTKWSKLLRYSVFGDLSYYTQLHTFAERARANAEAAGSSGVLVVGHSLGGGLAQMIGANMKLSTFAVSGVGVGYQGLYADFNVEDSRDFLSVIIGTNDPVPLVDKQIGAIQQIECTCSRFSFSCCHHIETTFEELARTCGDLRDPHNTTYDDEDGDAPMIVQIIIWFISMLIFYVIGLNLPHLKRVWCCDFLRHDITPHEPHEAQVNQSQNPV